VPIILPNITSLLPVVQAANGAKRPAQSRGSTRDYVQRPEALIARAEKLQQIPEAELKEIEEENRFRSA
jgi:hypothetical protein